MAKHEIVHIEIPAKDPKAGSKFYADLFGWKLEEFPDMDYITFEVEEGPGGGFPKVDDQVKPGDVTVYVSTDDIEETLAKIESLGGKTVVPKTEIPQTGWFALFTDPTGNTMALFTSMSQDG
jgi:hypothetical protein